MSLMRLDLGGFGAVSWCQWPWVSDALNPLDFGVGVMEGTTVTILRMRGFVNDLTDRAIGFWVPLMWIAEKG
jgi:hypothetical protein